jgi:hypothetical protein
VLFIDTNSNQYYIHLYGFPKLSFEAHNEEIFKIKIKVLHFTFSFYPLKKHTNTLKKKKTIERKKSSIKFSFKTTYRVLKSFKVKQFLLNIDTGNYVTNAKWHPIFALLNYKIGGFNINFEDKNELLLCLRNRPINILKSFINF